MFEQAETAAFGSDRGGVGKSKAAELRISRYFMTHARLPTIIEVEADPRLSLIYGEDNVQLFRIAQNRLIDIERNPSLIYRMWDQIGDVCMQSKTDVVLDIGANMTRSFAIWLQEYGQDGPFGTGAPLTFFGLTTGDRLAVESVHQALRFVATVVPESKRYLVINQRDAQFPLAADSPVAQELAKRHDLRAVLRMPACLSPGLAHVVNRNMRLDKAAERPIEWWERECKFPRLEAVRAHRRLLEFLDEGTRMFDAVYGPMPTASAA